MSNVARAVESGASTVKGVIDATGLSRLKVERALQALQKQKLLVRDGQGIGCRASRLRCPSANADHAPAAAPSSKWLPSISRSISFASTATPARDSSLRRSSGDVPPFSCAWLQGHLDDDWYPETAGMVVHLGEGAVNIAVDPALSGPLEAGAAFQQAVRMVAQRHPRDRQARLCHPRRRRRRPAAGFLDAAYRHDVFRSGPSDAAKAWLKRRSRSLSGADRLIRIRRLRGPRKATPQSGSERPQGRSRPKTRSDYAAASDSPSSHAMTVDDGENEDEPIP